jgi:hypothetical protein
MQGRKANPLGISDQQINAGLNERASQLVQQKDELMSLQQILSAMEGKKYDPLNISDQQINAGLDERASLYQRQARELASLQAVLGAMQGRKANPLGISDEQVNATLNERAGIFERQTRDTQALQNALGSLESRKVNWGTALGIEEADIAADGAQRLASEWNRLQAEADGLAARAPEAAAALRAFKFESLAEGANSYTRALLNQQRTLDEYADAAGRAARATKELGYGGELPALRPAGFTDQDARIKNLIDDQTKAADIVADYERKAEMLVNDLEIGNIQRQLNAELDSIETTLNARKKADEEWWSRQKAFLDQKTKIEEQQARRAQLPFLEQRFGKRGSAAISEGLIGGAFPLLFGQGIGASAGGLAGGVAGGFAGGGLGFGLSLIGTAFGSMLDTLNQAAQDTGKALNYPIEGFEKLRTAGLFASRQQEYYISKLIETGQTARATAEIQAEMIKKIGVSGVNDLMELGDSSTRLGKAWAELNLQLQAALAGPMAGLLEWVASIAESSNQSSKSQRLIEDVSSGLSGEARKKFDREIEAISFKGLTMDETARQKAALAEFYKPLAKPAQVRAGKPDPKLEEENLNKAMQDAEKIRSLNEQGVSLQRKADEMRRSNEDAILGLRERATAMEREAVDFRRSIEDEIFNKRQELEKLLIENDRKRQQNAIDSVDLEIQRLASGLDPVSASIIDAGREYIKLIGEALADKEQRERSLALDIVQVQRQADKFKLQVEDRVYQMNKQRDEFSRDVARTRLQMENQSLDYAIEVEKYRMQMAERRVELAIREGDIAKAAAIAGQEGLAVPGTGKNYASAGGFQGGRQMLHGIPGYAGYDASHASETNIHYHFAGKNPAETKAVAEYLKGLGYKITEFSGFGQRVGGHRRGSQHYKNNAFDIPGASMEGKGGMADIIAGQRQVHARINDFLRVRDGQTPAVRAASSVTGATATRALPTPPTAKPLPTVPVAQGRVGFDDLLGQDLALANQIIQAKKDGNRADQVALDLRIKQGQAALIEKALQPVKAIEDQTRAVYEEIEARKLRNYLAAEGYSPEYIEGQIRVLEAERNFNKLIGAQDELLKTLNKGKFDSATSSYDAAVARLAELNTLKELNPELAEELLNLQGILAARGALTNAKPGAVVGIIDAAKASEKTPREKVQERVGNLKKEMKELISMDTLAIRSADAIGDAYGQAFQGLVNGSMSAQEALASFFKSTAEAFLAMATEIIAKQMVMVTLQTILKALGAVAGASSVGSGPTLAANGATFANGIAQFAKGGAFTNSIVSSPTLFQFADGGVTKMGGMGEAGPEAIMPLKRGPDGRLGVDASGMAAPYQRSAAAATTPEMEVPYQRSGPGLAVPYLKSAGDAAGDSMNETIDVKFETVRIGGVDYVTRDEAEQIGRESAQRGADLAHKRYRNSPSARRAVGMSR